MAVLESGMVFKKDKAEDYFVVDKIVDNIPIGILFGKDSATGQWAINRDYKFDITSLDNWTMIEEFVSLDGILLTGLIASLQIGIRRRSK